MNTQDLPNVPLPGIDYYRGQGDLRIKVAVFLNVSRIEGLYFEREKSLRLLWNYWREIGFKAVLTKIRSRHAERARNVKFLSVGVGYVEEADSGSQFARELVMFVAPQHPRLLDSIVLCEALVHRITNDHDLPEKAGVLIHDEIDSSVSSALEPLCGWDKISQTPIPAIDWSLISRMLHDHNYSAAKRYRNNARDYHDILPASFQRKTSGNVKYATLFGYGNYAKSVILANLPDSLVVTRIHELDPIQIPHRERHVTWDTSPGPRTNDANRVFFTAGYHHTHTDQAVICLRSGGDAVIEKPLVVNEQQLSDLLDGLQASRGRAFACFQKRYSIFNQHAREDLEVAEGEPVSYHCIVYEVPLPPLHWYRWPSSRSRLISNGCHWIDHALYLNGFPAFETISVFQSSSSEINVSVEFSNGAFFTMILTDKGSSRIGMQDYVELRANGKTVKIANSTSYQSESSDRIIRKCRANKMKSYANMYRTIGQRILGDGPGDSLESVVSSCKLTLELDKKAGGTQGVPS